MWLTYLQDQGDFRAFLDRLFDTCQFVLSVLSADLGNIQQHGPKDSPVAINFVVDQNFVEYVQKKPSVCNFRGRGSLVKN